MSYINKLNSEEVDILMNHSEGLKSERTDFKILEDYNNENALSNFNEDKAFRSNFNSPNTIEQIPLFPV